MPQLELASYPSQIFWLAIFFSCLYYFVKCRIAPAIESLVAIRDNRIEIDLVEASKARGRAVELHQEYDLKRKNVFFKVSEMLEGELSNLNKLSLEQTNKVNTDIQALTQKAEEEITAQKNKYRQELEEVVLEYSAYLLRKVSNLDIEKESLRKYRN